MTRHYNFEDVVCMIAGISITEFAEGDAIEITRPQKKKYEKTQGSHGSVMRSKQFTNLAEIKVMLMQGSPIHTQLQELADRDEETGQGTGEFYVKDTNGTTQAVAPVCWIEEEPDMKFANTAGTIEWLFGAGNLKFTQGENRLA